MHNNYYFNYYYHKIDFYEYKKKVHHENMCNYLVFCLCIFLYCFFFSFFFVFFFKMAFEKCFLDVEFISLNLYLFYIRASEFLAKGVRWIYKGERSGEQLTFSHDIEPEYIVLSEDESIAYVVLQENNAIAKLDVANAEFLDIYPLGYKDWSQSGFDASDKDGRINIQKWPIRGLYQPDGIRLFKHNGKQYLVTANEGDLKSYKLKHEGLTWAEMARGKVFVDGNMLDESVPESLREALSDDKKLGRLYLSLIDGKNPKTGLYENLYAYGGRSFTIWDPEMNMTKVYDSGADFENYHAELLPEVFNNHVGDRTHTPEDDFDVRSDDMGPEVEVVETASIGNKTYFFVGNQRVSTVIVYSTEKGKPIAPKFEGLFRPGGSRKSWQELFDNKDVGDTNTQDMKYVF